MDLTGENSEYDYYQEIATSCYGDMLHDDERNKKFRDGLINAINKMHLRGEKAHVLDIGTGTGLLSMLALRHGADTVVACEMFQPVAQCARNIIERNGYGHRIKVVSKHSTALTVGPGGDLPHRANILVSEVFDTELIGEGALQTFNHAHRDLLEENSIVIPSVGIIYGQVVESKSCLSWNKLEDCQVDERTVVQVPTVVKSCAGAPSLHDIQLSQLPCSEFKSLSQPLELFRFDFMRQKKLPKNESVNKTSLAVSSGTAHVLFMWWDLIMDDEGDIVLSCAPAWHHPDAPKVLPNGNPALSIPWRDHWMQAVYFFPDEEQVLEGQELILRAYHDEFSLWCGLGNESEYKAPICDCGFHLHCSRTRIGGLNDPLRRSIYIESLREISKHKNYYLFLGDFSLLPLIIAKMGAKRVFILNKSSSVRVWKQFLACNNLNSIVSFHEELNSIVEIMKELNASKYDLCILGEPFFETSLLAWNNVCFSSQVSQMMDSLKPYEPVIFIKGLKIKACCVHFDDLSKISKPIGNCLDFNVTLFDKMISKAKLIAQKSIEPQPLWEYPCRALSPVKTLFHYDFKNSLRPAFKSTTLDLNINCQVNGVAVWAEYELFNGGIIRTGPINDPQLGEYIEWDRFERQGVHFIEDCSRSKTLSCTVSFDEKNSDFNFCFSIENIIKA